MKKTYLRAPFFPTYFFGVALGVCSESSPGLGDESVDEVGRGLRGHFLPGILSGGEEWLAGAEREGEREGEGSGVPMQLLADIF